MGILNAALVFSVYSMNFILLVGALFLMYACLSDHKYKEFSDILPSDFEFYALFPKILLIVSIILAIVSFLGCFGIAIDNDYMLIIYVIILVILMASKIFIIIFLTRATNSDEFGEEIRSNIIKQIRESRPDALHHIQLKYKCCGVDSYEDWTQKDSKDANNKIPGSCCGKKKKEICLPSEIFSKVGCKKWILNKITVIIRILTGTVLHVFVIELLLAVFTTLILFDVGQSSEIDDLLFTGHTETVTSSKEDEMKFGESVDTHDSHFKEEYGDDDISYRKKKQAEEVIVEPALTSEEEYQQEIDKYEEEIHEEEPHEEEKPDEEKYEELSEQPDKNLEEVIHEEEMLEENQHKDTITGKRKRDEQKADES